MSNYVLLDLLNELRKDIVDFLQELNISNNTGAQMLDSVYHMTLKILKNHICMEITIFAIFLFYTTLKWTSLRI